MLPAFAHVKARVRDVIIRHVPMLDRHRAARQFVKFCLVGGSNVIVYFSAYLLLTRGLGWYFLYGSMTSFLVAVSWSFYWNRRWTFRLTVGDHRQQYQRFVITNVVSGVASNTVLYFLVERFGWYDIYANFVTIGFTTAWNFLVTKFWAFRH